MRIAVIGAGGTGGLYGAILARGGADVVFVARGAHLAAIRARGLQVRSKLFGEFTVAAEASDDPAVIADSQVILFCTKTYDAHSALERLAPVLPEAALLIPIQNGIDGANEMRRLVSEARVLGGVALGGGVITEPGVVEERFGALKVIFGEWAGGMSDRVRELEIALRGHGLDVEATKDIQAAVWEKFIIACAFSGLTALTRLPIGEILRCEATADLYAEVMREVERLSRAAGVAVRPSFSDHGLTMTRALRETATSSMYYDLMAGRRLELEAINGAAVRLGRELGVPTPHNTVIYAALKPYSNGSPLGATDTTSTGPSGSSGG